MLEATVENIDRQRQNTLSEYRLHGRSARPLRLYEGNEIHLYTDGNYNIRNYILTYLRTPKRLALLMHHLMSTQICQLQLTMR